MTREPDRVEEAAAWANRLDQPAIDTSSGPTFDRWMNESDRNGEAFADVQALWHSDTLKQALQDVAGAGEHAAVGPYRRSVWRQPWAAAVTFGLCAVLVLTVTLFSGLSFATYRTGSGDGRSVLLADGSRVDLSGNSELRVRILPWQRTATLARGEAFFDVRHERARSFRVHSGTTTVRVLGTAFNVDRQSDARTVVHVFRGAVQVDSPGVPRMVLHKDERTQVHGGRMVPEAIHSVARIPDWKSGWFEADEVPLNILFAKVQRYSDRPIEIDAVLGEQTISGRFRVSDPARVLMAVREAYGVNVDYTGKRIRITPNSALKAIAPR